MPVAQPHSQRAGEQVRQMREKTMQSTWIGHSYEELVEVLGAPRMVMNIPAYRPWQTSVAVYEGLDAESGCVDAFAVASSAVPVVYDYFCR